MTDRPLTQAELDAMERASDEAHLETLKLRACVARKKKAPRCVQCDVVDFALKQLARGHAQLGRAHDKLAADNKRLCSILERLADAAAGFNVSGVYFTEDSANKALIDEAYKEASE
jgi:hypothetical protein